MGEKKRSGYRNKVLRDVKGKEQIYYMPDLKEGDYVTIRRTRPRRKYRGNKSYRGGKYFRVVAGGDLYGCFLRANSDVKLANAEKERARLKVYGYKTYDLFDFDHFIADNFPKMIEKFLAKYTDVVSEDSPYYSEVVKALTELKTFLDEEAKDDRDWMPDEEWEAYHSKMVEVWANFGKIFRQLWI